MVQKGVNIPYLDYPNTVLKQFAINAIIWRSPGSENIQIWSLNMIMLSTMSLIVTGGIDLYIYIGKSIIILNVAINFISIQIENLH
jgi:hypothetical protein